MHLVVLLCMRLSLALHGHFTIHIREQKYSLINIRDHNTTNFSYFENPFNTRSRLVLKAMSLLAPLYTPFHPPRQPIEHISPRAVRFTRVSTITHISLGIHLHLRHGIIILHVLLGDVTAILDSLDALLEVVGCHFARVQGGL